MLSITEYLAAGQTVLSNYILRNYRRIGLTHEEFIFWLQLFHYHQAKNDFPNVLEIAAEMQLTPEEGYALLNQLLEKQIIKLETGTDQAGKKVDFFDFDPIYQKISLLKDQEKKQVTKVQTQTKVAELYQGLEKEFGRSLSPIEYQKVGQWLEEDRYTPELIQLALREAVLNQAYNLNYMDRILLSWERKNIRTPQQVQAEQQKRTRTQLQKKAEENQSEETIPKISLHDWLNGD